ncbi:hypothetical protein HYC85_015081 [Camellia sinensis]|uniref:Uncharacterized protein n=1 Tax=Camellia sinensis TaxID=4442 RepID=A0A7J7HB71_CAMSI|nr:hypothetical protein HYC85_015081 [Camellia sinensis]
MAKFFPEVFLFLLEVNVYWKKSVFSLLHVAVNQQIPNDVDRKDEYSTVLAQ